ncbi:hypothetical protein GCM10023217_07800 [Gordonia alkaliphila]|uniref:Helix-turn-helix domain-containing protein n=1 Tax=Gordonia alkaliphila TaxID=1053547 RepID=A0ABP8YWU6_9ACTN
MTTQSTARVEWVGPAEYARLHKLHVKTVYRRLRAGHIPGAEQPEAGHAYRIPVRIG